MQSVLDCLRGGDMRDEVQLAVVADAFVVALFDLGARAFFSPLLKESVKDSRCSYQRLIL